MIKEIDSDVLDKMIDRLRFYYKEQTKIKLIYNRITVSGVITKIKIWFCKEYIILNAEGVPHKIFIEDISPETIFPNDTKIEEHFINPSHFRKSIPKSIKNEIWHNRFGERFTGKCFVCNNKIRKDNFEAGHIISARDNGPDTIDNLRPICRTCNRSMGTQNLEDFKRTYYS